MNDLLWCIDYLKKYNNIVDDFIIDFSTFRALMNITMPYDLSDEYYLRQDKVLKDFYSKKIIVNSFNLKYTNQISIYKGDITLLSCDAIVNACNEKLLGCFHPLHNCIDNAIHSFAGLQVRRDLIQVMSKQNHDEENGLCKVTSGYNLPSKYIFHTVGPRIDFNITYKDRKDLRNCYVSCLNKAMEMNLKSIAFPCISTGIYGFDKREACDIAFDVVSSFVKENKLLNVIFVLFKEEDLLLYKRKLGMLYDN